ncbi:MAG: hypothetical protein OXU20_07520 [Myxococcales bacterium]|nr:hypothetical protein [Myxococcales bacterium]MDD9966513.1 hypothetical protein [Myxococcales bacterium]
MRTIRAQDLPELPEDVASLVAQGIYSLFELKDSAAKYLLLTSHRDEFYLLDDAGGIAIDPNITSVERASIVAAVSLALPESADGTNGLRISSTLAVAGLK